MREYTEKEQEILRDLVRDKFRREEPDKVLCIAYCWTPAGKKILEDLNHPDAICFTNLGLGVKVVAYADGDNFKIRLERV